MSGINTMRITPAIALLSALALGACATASPETRVRTALIDAGVDRPVAACMAERMVDRLSISQLRKLGSLSKIRDQDVRTMTVDQLLRRTRALGDPEILQVVTTAGIGCAIAA